MAVFSAGGSSRVVVLGGPAEDAAGDVRSRSALQGRERLAVMQAEVDAESLLHDFGGGEGDFAVGQARQIANGRGCFKRVALAEQGVRGDEPEGRRGGRVQ